MSSDRGAVGCSPYTLEGWWDRFVVVLPWILLVPTTIVVFTTQGSEDRIITTWLAGTAALLVLFGHTLVGAARRYRPAHALVYFVALFTVSCALMAHETLFLMFTITAFFHALALQPRWMAFLGVGATSTALHTATMGLPGVSDSDMPFLYHLLLYVGVITIQTVAISAGLMAGQRGAEQYRERQEMVAKLEAALEENAGLHAQLLNQVREAGVLDERQRMAQEIHDTLAQGLTGIITQVQAAQRSTDPATAEPHLDRALLLARESLNEARRSVQALRPPQLDEAHLPEALMDLAQQWIQGGGLAPEVEITGERMALSPVIEVALFRVAQEALTNVAKHAHASRVGLTLSYLDDVVLLDIRDDGTGVVQEGASGFGLSSMRQRVRSIGGTVQIESEPGSGTAVSAAVPAIPLAAAAQNDAATDTDPARTNSGPAVELPSPDTAAEPGSRTRQVVGT